MLIGISLLVVASMVVYGFYLKSFYFNTPRPPHKPAANGEAPK